LASFANNPQFAMLAQRMRENPAFYQEFMQMLQQQQPALYNAIQQNPMAFMNLIMGGQGGGAGAGIPGMGAGAGAGGAPAGGAPGQGPVGGQ